MGLHYTVLDLRLMTGHELDALIAVAVERREEIVREQAAAESRAKAQAAIRR